MPVQQQMSSFAKKLGGRVAQANAEHKEAPVDTGNRRLPGGIRNGIARLVSMYTKEYEDDKNGTGTKGQTFFRASAVVITPAIHDGEKVAGMLTQKIVPLCDMPAKGKRKASTFSENWFEFQNLFKLLGVAPCQETPATDPTGQKTEAYFFAAMKALTDPVRMKVNPVYISFSTRAWTPDKPHGWKEGDPVPQEMVFETWHGLATFNGKIDPASGVTQQAPQQPPLTSLPPKQTAPPPESTKSVEELVQVAMDDPQGATTEGTAAHSELERRAWANGWTKEDTGVVDTWAEVGQMALNPKQEPSNVDQPPTPEPPVQDQPPAIVVGSRWKFAKRTKDGEKLKNSKGEEFPPQEVEVTSMDLANGTCTVKTVKDNKVVLDVRTKEPINVKFEWLEYDIPY